MPTSVLRGGEILFTRPNDALLRAVRISPKDARAIATAEYGASQRPRVVFESLGGYIDANDIVHDWVGTRSYVPRPVPAYLVRIHEAQGETVDPSVNHFWNVLVDARTGKVLISFTFD